jgi:DNA polymerase elongation subunit (family B)
MRYLILDIETIPHPDAHLWADPVRPSANLKDPEKIAADIESKRAKQADEFGLDPDTNRTVALGFVDAAGGDPAVYLMSNELEEREHLKMFADIYKQQDTRLVTFNGFRFDLPVLMRRAMYLDVKFPVLSVDRYRSEHIDIWQRLSFNGAINAHSLKFYAKRLGIGTLDKVDGKDIARLAAEDTEESWQAIHDHCLSDVGLCHAVALRLGVVPRIGVAA